MALLGILGGGLVSVAGWLRIKALSTNPIDPTSKSALIIQTVMYTVLAVVSLFGLIGTFNKARRLISLYSTVLFSHLGFSIATGAFFLYTLFHQTGDADISSCINGSTETLKIEACQKSFEVIRGVIVGIFVLTWLIELYGCIIVANYADQLNEEESLNDTKPVTSPPVAAYAPTYAFAQPAYSHGVQGSNNV
jgi:hypothetical protein